MSDNRLEGTISCRLEGGIATGKGMSAFPAAAL